MNEHMPCVLVIDDEEILVELTGKFLELAGLVSKGFTSAEQAIAWYQTHHTEVGLVVLDMKMTTMDGPECFHALRKINPEVKVAILSGYIQDTVAQDLLNQGALRFFQKPLKYPELIDWILGVLGSAS